ncbi:AAA family ATPase [Nitrobacter sp.]|uniref:AAA family ATPase n=1 Tax=Nitrobacter sp. TaxID=29420 RepID=UPI003F64A2BC
MSRDDYLKDIPFPPDWIANPPTHLVRGSVKRGNLEVAPTHSVDESSLYARAVLDKLSSELARETRGGRNDMLNKVAYTMGGHIAGNAIERAEVEAALTSACHRNGLMKDGAAAVEKTIASGINSGMLRPIVSEDASIADDDIGSRIGSGPTAARKHEKFRVTMFDDIEETAAKEWVVEGFIAAGEFSYAVGKPGASKSVIFTDAACHVGAGMEWHGRKVKKGLVVYFAAERGATTRRRMMAFRKHHNVSGVAVAVIEGAADLTNGLADAVTLAERIVELGKDCDLPPVWIIVDTLSRTFGGGDQNKSQDMGKFIRAVDTIIEKTGAHVTVIHHTPWEQDRAKGAIDLDGAVDVSFIVWKNKERCTLRCDGANDQEEGKITAYTMKSVELGTDENGKVTNAPVVIRDEAATDSDDCSKLTSKKPVLAVRLFETAIKEKGEVNPDNGQTAVHASRLREIILREQDKSSHATEKSREVMVRRIIRDIRTKAADEIGEWFYPKAANDNIKDHRTGIA